MSQQATVNEYRDIANSAISHYQDIFHSHNVHIDQFQRPEPTISEIQEKIDLVREIKKRNHNKTEIRRLNRVIKDLEGYKLKLEGRIE